MVETYSSMGLVMALYVARIDSYVPPPPKLLMSEFFHLVIYRSGVQFSVSNKQVIKDYKYIDQRCRFLWMDHVDCNEINIISSIPHITEQTWSDLITHINTPGLFDHSKHFSPNLNSFRYLYNLFINSNLKWHPHDYVPPKYGVIFIKHELKGIHPLVFVIMIIRQRSYSSSINYWILNSLLIKLQVIGLHTIEIMITMFNIADIPRTTEPVRRIWYVDDITVWASGEKSRH